MNSCKIYKNGKKWWLFVTLPAPRISAGGAVPTFGLFLTCRKK
jgi:hypothetical protein